MDNNSINHIVKNRKSSSIVESIVLTALQECNKYKVLVYFSNGFRFKLIPREINETFIKYNNINIYGEKKQ